MSFRSDPQYSDHFGLEKVEENNDLCDALQKCLKEIEESTVLVEKNCDFTLCLPQLIFRVFFAQFNSDITKN